MTGQWQCLGIIHVPVHAIWVSSSSSSSCLGDWNLYDWKMTENKKAGVENAGLENNGLENAGPQIGRLENEKVLVHRTTSIGLYDTTQSIDIQ